MPYRSLADLPEAQVDQYSTHQKHAFLEAFNSAFDQYGGDEGRAFATAHAAAQQTPEQKGDHESSGPGKGKRKKAKGSGEPKRAQSKKATAAANS